MMGDTPHLFFSDFTRKEIESSIYLSRIRRNNLTFDILGECNCICTFASSCCSDDDYNFGFFHTRSIVFRNIVGYLTNLDRYDRLYSNQIVSSMQIKIGSFIHFLYLLPMLLLPPVFLKVPQQSMPYHLHQRLRMVAVVLKTTVSRTLPPDLYRGAFCCAQRQSPATLVLSSQDSVWAPARLFLKLQK